MISHMQQLQSTHTPQYWNLRHIRKHRTTITILSLFFFGILNGMTFWVLLSFRYTIFSSFRFALWAKFSLNKENLFKIFHKRFDLVGIFDTHHQYNLGVNWCAEKEEDYAHFDQPYYCLYQIYPRCFCFAFIANLKYFAGPKGFCS